MNFNRKTFTLVDMIDSLKQLDVSVTSTPSNVHAIDPKVTTTDKRNFSSYWGTNYQQ